MFSANLRVLVNTSYSEKVSIVQTDPDKTVCLTTLETLEEMLKTIGTSVPLEKQTVTKLCSAVTSVLEQKVYIIRVFWIAQDYYSDNFQTFCQGADSEDDNVADDDEMVSKRSGITMVTRPW